MIGVAPDFVNRPAARQLVARRACSPIMHARIRHVVEDVAPADRVGRAGRRDVVDLADLDRRHVAILGEAGRHEADVAPPVGADRRAPALPSTSGPDPARRSSTCRCRRSRAASACRPGCRAARRCRPTSRSSAISSSVSDGSCLNFWMPMFFSTNNGGIAPRWLRSAVRVLIARAHGRDVFVGDERHRRDAAGVVALLAAALENRGDVPGEGDARRTGLLGGRVRPAQRAKRWPRRRRLSGV